MRFYPFMLRLLAVSASILGITILLAGKTHAQDVQPTKITTPITHMGPAIDWTRYPYPIDNTELSPGGYPIFLVECNNGECYGPTGEDIGTEQEIASQLPAIKAVDARQPTYRCNYVCVDAERNLVGANPLRPVRQ